MKHFRVAIVPMMITLLSGCSAVKITDKPIIFNEERKELTLDYLEERYGLIQNEPTIIPRMIVVHWTVIPTLEKSYEAFENPRLPNWRPAIANASAVNVSSQFLIDTDGKIYRLMPENWMARHVIGLNHCAIGIENVGPDENNELTEKQLKANVKLIRYLTGKYDIEFLIGHLEYTRFVDHPLWLEKDDNYRTVKTDPGIKFMRALREATDDLPFSDLPTPKALEYNEKDQ